MKRPLLIVFVLAALTAGCGSSSEPGVEVRFVSLPSGLVPGETRPGASARAVSLDELEWTTAELELLPCRTALGRLADFLVPSAHAHGVTTPTRLAVPTVERATAGEEVLLGTLEPPAGRYCGLRYRLAPADADAEGLSASPSMEGHALAAFGTVHAPDTPTAPFVLTSSRTAEAELELDLELSEERRQATVLIGHDRERWFPALDGTGSAAEREARLLDAFLGSLHTTDD